MTAALIVMLEQLARKYADKLLEDGLSLARKALMGHASDEEVIEYIHRIQKEEQLKGVPS